MFYNKDISILGIAFQRLKIILEKMTYISMKNQNIYYFDKLCDDIQTLIFSWIKNYFDNFLNKKSILSFTIDNINFDTKLFTQFLYKINDSDIIHL